MKTLISLFIVALFSINTYASESQSEIQLPGYCSVRINNMIEISVNFNHQLITDFEYGENLFEGEIMLDSGYLGGNRCSRFEDGYGCTQVGVPSENVLLKLKKNGVIKIKTVMGSDYGSHYTDVQSLLYRKIIIRTKFKIQDGKVFVIRNFKKREMKCY